MGAKMAHFRQDEGLYKIYKFKNRAKYFYSKYKNMEMEVSYI